MSSAPATAPSMKNWTPATPTSSVALAVMSTVPFTVAPFAGDVIDTDGALMSLATLTDTVADVVTCPALSRATAATACGPLPTVVVFQSMR